MTVLVDTPLWSLLLRRPAGDLSPDEARRKAGLVELICEGRVRLLGPVRQEVLSGIRQEQQFERVRDALRAFPDEPIDTGDREDAARAANTCRRHGIAGSGVDFLICAVALRRQWRIFTTDRDFSHFSRHLRIALHGPV